MQFKKKIKVFCPTICIHSTFIIVFPVCLNLKADRMNKPYRRSFLFLSRAPPQKRYFFFGYSDINRATLGMMPK